MSTRITIPITRWEKIVDADGVVRGGQSVPNGTRSGDVILEVSEEGLKRLLGFRALKNKSRKAEIAGGLVRARVINVKEAK